jgi:citrate synthase
MVDGERVPDGADAPQVWWRTELVASSPEGVWFRGRPIEELIGTYSVADLLWLLVVGEDPEPASSRLLEAVLVAGASFGPRAPSIAVARMAATCGVPMNGVLASAVGLLGDVHGGAIEQAGEVIAAVAGHDDLDAAADEVVGRTRATGGFVPGFGHRFLTRDPRAVRMLALVREHLDDLDDDGRHLRAGLAVEAALARRIGRPLPMNVDGGSAVALLSIGFPTSAYRGVFCLSRSVGILAEAHEELLQGGRLKGPSHPRDGSVAYVGPPPRATGADPGHPGVTDDQAPDLRSTRGTDRRGS